MFVINVTLLSYTCTYLMFLIMLKLFVYFTLDGGFQAFLRVRFEEVKQVRPLYGCKQNQGAIHKTTRLLCHHETTVHILHEDTLRLPTMIDRMVVHHVVTISRLVVDLFVLFFRAQRGPAY
jgi:hypothetical protein